MCLSQEGFQDDLNQEGLKSFADMLCIRAWELAPHIIRDDTFTHYRDDALQVTCRRLLQMPVTQLFEMKAKSVEELEAFLRHALRNNYRQVIRDEKRRYNVALSNLTKTDDEVEDTAALVERDDFRAYACQLVDKALDTLTPYERAVWILRKRVGWSHKHIAKRLRTRELVTRKEGAIRKTCHMAERKLKAFLEAGGYMD